VMTAMGEVIEAYVIPLWHCIPIGPAQRLWHKQRLRMKLVVIL